MKKLLITIILITISIVQGGVGSEKEKTYTVHTESINPRRGLTYIKTVTGFTTFKNKKGKEITYTGTFVVVEE